MNTSILKDRKYREMVEETVKELEEMQINNKIHKWQTFLLTIKAKSISYSQEKNKIKNTLKSNITKQILEMEEKQEQIKNEYLSRYNYLKQKLKDIEEKEIEGYIRRTKYFAQYEKAEPDIAFYSKLEGKKGANDTLGQLAEKKDGQIYTDNKNIVKIATNFYKELYTPNKTDGKKTGKTSKKCKEKDFARTERKTGCTSHT